MGPNLQMEAGRPDVFGPDHHGPRSLGVDEFHAVDGAPIWSDVEVEAMRAAANAVGAAITREAATFELAQAHADYASLVEQIPAVFYRMRRDGPTETTIVSPQNAGDLGDDQPGTRQTSGTPTCTRKTGTRSTRCMGERRGRQDGLGGRVPVGSPRRDDHLAFGPCHRQPRGRWSLALHPGSPLRCHPAQGCRACG